MTPETNAKGRAPVFQGIARRAVRRVVLGRWFALLGRTSLAMFVVGAAVVAWARWWAGDAVDPRIALALVLVWGAATALVAWRRRPSAVSALALWDERADRKEMFASALCFESSGASTPGEALHLARARAALAQDGARMKRDLPVRLPHRAWLATLAFVAVALTSTLLSAPRAAEDLPLDETARQRVQAEAEKIAAQKSVLDPLEGLTPEEQEKVEKLQSSLDDTAKKLGMLEGQTPREVLAELERRALEAEQLAEALGAGNAQELSSDMIAEFERHADTADLAAALRANDAEKIAEEVENLAKRLRRKELSMEEQERIASAIEQGLRAGSRADRLSLLGRNMQQALRHLQNNRRQQAANQLSSLANQFAQSALRQQSQRRLQQLAQSLRSSGQRISGGNPRGMQRLAQNAAPSGLSPLGNRPLQPFSLAQMGNLAGRMRSGSRSTGQCPGGQCPVPGSCPGGQCQGAGAGQSAGTQAPIPGAGRGGLRAGRGSAAYARNPTARMPVGATQVVDAQPTGQGPSEIQEVEGQERDEGAGRTTQDVALALIQAEEEALSAEPLPPTRREQVLRYFTALRQQLEQQPPSDD